MDPATIAALVTGGLKIFEKFVPDKDKQEKFAYELTAFLNRSQHEINLAQIGVNLKEAAHQSLFVAGWRPFIGWTCGLSIFNNYLLAPYVDTVLMIRGVTYTVTVPNEAGQLIEVERLAQMPVLDLVALMPLVLGMLGLVAARTHEKTRGVAREK